MKNRNFEEIVLSVKALLGEQLIEMVGRESGHHSVHEMLESLANGSIQHLADLEVLRDLREQVLEDNPTNRGWIGTFPGSSDAEKEVEYLKVMMGSRKLQRLQAACKRMHLRFNIWYLPVIREGMSDSQKTWLETRAHGEVETAVTYKMEDGGSVRFGYDGDEGLNPQLAADEQESSSYIIPYLRERDGTVVMMGDYKVSQIYVARVLPLAPGKKPVLVQELLQQFAEAQAWVKLQGLAKLMRSYKLSMRDRDTAVRTMRNGFRYVYYIQYTGGIILYSPITYGELAPEPKAEVDRRNKANSLARKFKEAIEAANGAESFQQAKGLYQQMLVAIKDASAWWLWKQYVAPYQVVMADDLTADDLGLD